MKALTLLSALLLLLGGCSHVLSDAALQSVDPTVEFAQVKADPDAHVGKTLTVGGKIVSNTAKRDGSTLEILRYTLDRYGNPIAADEAGGRFLVRSERFLDPEIYQEGALVTLAGTVMGEETRPLDGIGYSYPVFRLGEIHLWNRTPYHRGHYYRDPFYYDPFYDPFYRPYPFWRPYHPWYSPYGHRYFY